eukprot:450476-Prymnesium_polylepis.1
MDSTQDRETAESYAHREPAVRRCINMLEKLLVMDARHAENPLSIQNMHCPRPPDCGEIIRWMRNSERSAHSKRRLVRPRAQPLKLFVVGHAVDEPGEEAAKRARNPIDP